ncbi:MAG: macro domain-containing protein [Desulfobacula sp.]|nr:macro domain-containing protein [Desulfobacula sp.]
MIEYKTGDLLKDTSEAIVNTVNCVGVMGRGIALQFKKAFPENFKVYAAACKKGEVQPGKMFVVATNEMLGTKYIINFPTKRHWRGKSKLEDIQTGLKDLAAVIEKYKIQSIAIPPLGSGLGGLDWSNVKQLINEALKKVKNVNVIVYEPLGAPSAKKMVRNTKTPNMTSGRASLIELIHKYLSGLLDPIVSLLEVHKLMYFLQESGEPLRLNYKKAQYGPYADNIRHVLNHIEGYYISGYADGGDNPNKPLQLVPGAHKEAINYLSTESKTRDNLQKVADLVDGFESPYGLELLSTVHWVMKQESACSEDQVISHIHNWNWRKQGFTPRQINIAIDALSKQGWLENCCNA